MKSTFLNLWLWTALGLILSPASFADELAPSYIRIVKAKATHEVLHKLQFSEDHIRSKKYFYGYVPASKKNLIKKIKGIEIVPEIITLRDFDPETPVIKIPSPEQKKQSFEDLQVGYRSNEQIYEKLQDLAHAYPYNMIVKSAGKSVKEADLWYAELYNSVGSSTKFKKPNVLLIANMHGNETAGRSVMVNLVEDLLTESSKLLDHVNVFIMPTMNPDGFALKRRGNARYIDLNRDFPDFVTDPNVTQENRQPETIAIMKLHEIYHFDFALNFHGGAVCFNMPWDTVPNQNHDEMFPEHQLMSHLASGYAQLNETMHNSREFEDGITFGYEWYPVHGGMQDWAAHYHDSVHATVELTENKWPRASKLESVWLENRSSLHGFIASARHGFFYWVKNENGRLIDNFTFSHGMSQKVSKHRWQLTRPALPGVTKIKVEAEGYLPYELETSTADLNMDDIPVIVLKKIKAD